jgi:hypothetical protein
MAAQPGLTACVAVQRGTGSSFSMIVGLGGMTQVKLMTHRASLTVHPPAGRLAPLRAGRSRRAAGGGGLSLVSIPASSRSSPPRAQRSAWALREVPGRGWSCLGTEGTKGLG